MATPNQDYDLFLSHATEDTLWCDKLARRLKGEGVRVWFDQWEIRPADNIVARINDGLERSRQMAAVWTCIYFAPHKQWTDAESAALQYADILGSKRLLIPILRERGCTPPPTQAALKFVDFTDDARFDEAIDTLVRALLGTSIAQPPASPHPVGPAASGNASKSISTPDEAYQKWLEFVGGLLGVIIVFIGMLAFGVLLVCKGALYSGISFVAAAALAALAILCWLVKRNRRGAPFARQEFAFAANATDQLRAHYLSAQSGPSFVNE